MSRRNTCPTNGDGLDAANDQPVKTLSKRTADFIAKLAALVALDAALLGGWVLLLTVAIQAVGGVLQ